MTVTYIGDCVNCGCANQKHKGIDPKLRVQSRCTGSVYNPEASKGMPFKVYGPKRCGCTEYISEEIES